MPGPTNGVSLMRPERWGQSCLGIDGEQPKSLPGGLEGVHEAHWRSEVSRYDNPWFFARQCA